MNLKGIDSILLMLFSLPILRQYGILPTKTTPIWLFGIVYGLLFYNVTLSFSDQLKKQEIQYRRKKLIVTSIVLLVTLVFVMVTSIINRGINAPGSAYGVHDIVLQEEVAISYLLNGKNPYKETYFDTPVEEFGYTENGVTAINPALYHFVMPPWYLIFPSWIYVLMQRSLGYFDARVASVISVVGIFVILTSWLKDFHLKIISYSLVLLNPAMVHFVIEGRSDIFALFWFMLSILILEKKRYLISTVVFSLAVLSKQTIWFATPFYLWYLWLTSNRDIRLLIKTVMAFVIPLVIFSVPFIFWDAAAFINSVIFYLSGNTQHGYPISGYGFGMLLYHLQVIKNIHEYYPFIIWQVIIGLPVMIVLCMWMKKQLAISRLVLGYGFLLCVIWYFSRYLNDSHLGYISSIIVLGVVKQWDEKGKTCANFDQNT